MQLDSPRLKLLTAESVAQLCPAGRDWPGLAEALWARVRGWHRLSSSHSLGASVLLTLVSGVTGVRPLTEPEFSGDGAGARDWAEAPVTSEPSGNIQSVTSSVLVLRIRGVIMWAE